MDDQQPTDPSSSYASGWYPDPQGRYEQRYYDGQAWTAQVQSAGVSGYDGPVAAPAAYYSPSAVSNLGGRYPAASGMPTRRIGQNRLGAGFVLACLGWFVLLVATQMEWLAGQTLFELSDGAGAYAGSFAETVPYQAVTTIVFMLLVIIATTLPYQPGKFMGFLYGGCIGLVVCWNKLDANSPSIRSNLVGALVVLAHMGTIWYQLGVVTDQVPQYAGLAFGPGYWTFIGGLALLLVGSLLGRRYVRVDV